MPNRRIKRRKGFGFSRINADTIKEQEPKYKTEDYLLKEPSGTLKEDVFDDIREQIRTYERSKYKAPKR